jgi:hypothetical protein
MSIRSFRFCGDSFLEKPAAGTPFEAQGKPVLRRGGLSQFVFGLRRRRGLLGGRGFGFQCVLDAERKRFNASDVSGNGPEFFVGIPFAIGEHAGAADAVFGDPENLSFGERRACDGEPRNGREKGVAGLVGFAGSAVAAAALVVVQLSAGDEIFVGGRHRIGDVRCFAADGGVHGGQQEPGFEAGRREVTANFGEAESKVEETAEKDDGEGEQDAEQEVFHESPQR